MAPGSLRHAFLRQPSSASQRHCPRGRSRRRKPATRWQKLAAVPLDQFEQADTVGLATGGEHGGRARLDGTRAEPSIKRPTLAEAGIDKKLSAHARKVASIPEAEFEGIVGEWRHHRRQPCG